MVLLCGDGSIGPLNLQRIINSGGGEGAGPMGFCLHVHVRPFAVRTNTCSSTGSVGRGHVWLPLVHVHAVHGYPGIVRAANFICSERVSINISTCTVEADPIG